MLNLLVLTEPAGLAWSKSVLSQSSVFSSLFRVCFINAGHSCECEWTGSSPNLPWPLHTLEQIGRHCTSSHLLSIDSDIVMLSASACLGPWAKSVCFMSRLTELLGNYHKIMYQNLLCFLHLYKKKILNFLCFCFNYLIIFLCKANFELPLSMKCAIQMNLSWI